MSEYGYELALYIARGVTELIGDVAGSRVLSEKLADSPKQLLESLMKAHKSASFIEKRLNLSPWEALRHDIAYRAIVGELAFYNRNSKLKSSPADIAV